MTEREFFTGIPETEYDKFLQNEDLQNNNLKEELNNYENEKEEFEGQNLNTLDFGELYIIICSEILILIIILLLTF